LRLIASPDAAEGSVLIHQDARLYAGLFDGDEQATLQLDPARNVYVHVVHGNLHANDLELSDGDALQLTDVAKLTLNKAYNAEVLVFDLPRGDA
jgi:redox-sensitive bicupin YhaK (pirin superfamily)